MTNAPDTIEEQLKELRRQYKHACNVMEQMQKMNNQNEREIFDLEARLAAANTRSEACECGGECGEAVEVFKGLERICVPEGYVYIWHGRGRPVHVIKKGG